MCDRLFVVTGGPGAGKTCLIEALARQGVAHMPEVGRAVIREERGSGGTALPWGDRAAFAERMLQRDLRAFRAARAMPGPVLMDRGLPDVLGYLRLCGLPVPARVAAAARRFRYNRRVFFAPYWDRIFTTDSERRQGREEARATARIMAETYAGLGYDLVALPRTGIAERAAFVLERIGA